MRSSATLLDKYCAAPWSRVVQWLPADGEHAAALQVNIVGLPDFEIYVYDDLDLETEYRDALRGLLRAYLKSGRPIPAPWPSGSFQ